MDVIDGWWLSDDLIDQIVESGGEVPPNTLYGIPIVGNLAQNEIEALGEAAEDAVKYPDQCPETAATLLIIGRTRYGACPPILSHRSRPCECGRVHPNGLRKPWKTCCGKVSR